MAKKVTFQTVNKIGNDDLHTLSITSGQLGAPGVYSFGPLRWGAYVKTKRFIAQAYITDQVTTLARPAKATILTLPKSTLTPPDEVTGLGTGNINQTPNILFGGSSPPYTFSLLLSPGESYNWVAVLVDDTFNAGANPEICQFLFFMEWQIVG